MIELLLPNVYLLSQYLMRTLDRLLRTIVLRP